MWSTFAAIAAVGGTLASIGSVVERLPSVLALRLVRSLKNTTFRASRGSRFSDFSRLLLNGERPFSRVPLEQHLIARMRSCVGAGQKCLIVSGPGGIGKSVLWEALLTKRPENDSVDEGLWKGFAGPTRVINVLKCATLDDFRQEVVAALSSVPFLPSFGLSPPPSFSSALEVLETALRTLPSATPLVVFIEDINGLVKFPGWEHTFIQLATAVASNGNGIVVGNSSALLAYQNFESLSHIGLRTDTLFFPSLPAASQELLQYAQDGGHLFATVRPAGFSSKNLVPQIALWNGNVQLLKHATMRTVDAVCTRLVQCLESVDLVDKPQWSHLITPACVESSASVLKLRAALLTRLAETPGHEVPMLALPRAMRVLLISEQLAAVDLVTFRTLLDEAGGEYDVVAPYHPVVIELFKQYVVTTQHESARWASPHL